MCVCERVLFIFLTRFFVSSKSLGCQWSNTGKYIVSCSNDLTAKVWSAKTAISKGKKGAVVTNHDDEDEDVSASEEQSNANYFSSSVIDFVATMSNSFSLLVVG